MNDLNEAQRQAVEFIQGPTMILAGAGSGKTRALVSRIIYLLEEKKVSPFRVLALTFSNRAAREMRDRISSQVEDDIGALQMTTFHSFCARVLRSEANYLGLSRNFTIYDTAESKAIVKGILGRYGITAKKQPPFEILAFIEAIKNQGYYPGREKIYPEADEQIDKEDNFYAFYQEYEEELHRANAIDFGGLIIGVIQLLEKFPEVLERYQNRFEYILVDEYQDTNKAQFDLIKMLCEKKRNICVVGDEDQSIYSWRGADIHNILNFEKFFPNVRVLKLEQNYRSSKNIIEAANCVISRNVCRKGKSMWTDNDEGEAIRIVECFNEKKEGEFIAKSIVSLANDDGVDWGDIAVFYRANSQSRLIEDHLRQRGISYRIVGGIKFYERKEIKDMLAYLRLVVNDKDSLALSRIINVPPRGIGAITLRKLESKAVELGISLWELIEDMVKAPEKYLSLSFSARVKKSFAQFANIISEAKILDKDQAPPNEIYQWILYETGYMEMLKSRKDYESLGRIENLEEMENAIKQYEQEQKQANKQARPRLTGFLETITLDTSVQGREEEEGEKIGKKNKEEKKKKTEVFLMTVHGAKGLEFPYVFLAGAEEQIFPSYKSLDEGGDSGPQGLEEERRLFYVAMTRAMKKLTISFAQVRMVFGQQRFNGPSRFIQEIPSKYYVWQKVRDGYRGEKSWQAEEEREEDFSQETPCQDRMIYQGSASTSSSEASLTFSIGSVVNHALYGTGVILELQGSGPREKVLIRFYQNGAKKRFMLKYTPLTLLDGDAL